MEALLSADAARRSSLSAFEALRAEQKSLGSLVARATGEEKASLLARTKDLAMQVKAAQASADEAEAVAAPLLLALSNLIDPDAPVGGEEDFRLIEEIGGIPEFDFAPRDHVELGRMLGAIDLDRGAKVSGSRFYFFTGVGALLATALVRHAQDYALAAGLIPVLPPVLVRPEAMEGTGFLGQAAENVYSLPGEDLYLVGTSEVPMAAFHMDEILDLREGPLRYAAYSPCFRREAGAHGRDTRGIIRVHQFDKVEMFVFCDPAQAQAEHQQLLEHEKTLLSGLGLPFRVIDVASVDLGASAARKYDCEAWVPTQGKYREVTSTSNCTQFQARRLRIRSRFEGETSPVATLNGTLAAVPRLVVAILENFQRADGSVVVPEVLRPHVGREVLEPIAGR